MTAVTEVATGTFWVEFHGDREIEPVYYHSQPAVPQGWSMSLVWLLEVTYDTKTQCVIGLELGSFGSRKKSFPVKYIDFYTVHLAVGEALPEDLQKLLQ